MKNKSLSKVLSSITTVIMLTLITVGILLLVATYINAITEPKIIAEVVESKTISKLDDGSDHPTDEFVPSDSITAENGTGHVPPAFFGTQSYCIEPGTSTGFSFKKEMSDGSNFTREAYATLISKGKFHSSCIKKEGHATDQIPFDTPDGEGFISGTSTQVYYRYAGTVELSPALAYIMSSNENDTSDEEILDKQHAIWNLRGTGYDNDVVGTGNPIDDPDDPNDGDQPSKYDDEAKKYADFYSSVNSAGGGVALSGSSGGIVGANVNTETEEYIIGPFSASYIDVSPFSGISNMYCVGYNLNGAQVKSSIKIERIITQDKVTGTYKDDGTAPDFFDPDSNDDKIDRGNRNYPRTGQGFYIVIKDPNKGIEDDSLQRVITVALKIEFQWMETKYSADLYEGVHYRIHFEHECSASPKHSDGTGQYITTTSDTKNCSHYNCTVTEAGEDEEGNTISWVHRYEKTESDTGCDVIISGEEIHDQDIMLPKIERIVHTQEIELGRSIPLMMNIGGTVWEENFTGKESLANGIIDSGELLLKNIKVVLYTQDGKAAKLLNIDNGINPIYTDKDGGYKFSGLNPMKKYYVTFEYNGQIYMPAEYMVGDAQNWDINSKGTENTTERNSYDSKFATIGSYPKNYVTSNSLGYIQISSDGKAYNETFTRLDLMGYTLNENGKYSYNADMQLIDGYLYDEDGLQTNTYKEGIISSKINSYIAKNKKFPDLSSIYSEIAGQNRQLQRKLQFIEDCKITAYTKSQNGSYDLYPNKNQFVLGENSQSIALEGKIYGVIYPEQYHINLGLWRRPVSDLSLMKDVYKAAITINGQSQVYEYDDRDLWTEEESKTLAELEAEYGKNSEEYKNYKAELDYKSINDESRYWNISARVSDYNSYYSDNKYDRSVYPSDSNYELQNEEKRLEIYVTYKITIRNQGNVRAQVKEVVDYFDPTYELVEDMSWVMYGERQEVRVPDKEYLQIIDGKNISATGSSKYKGIASRPNSIYEGTESTLSKNGKTYQNIYIEGLEEHKLTSGENEYIYLTFKVKRNGEKLMLDEAQNASKQNIAEINGYTTWYNDNTQLPNGITKNSTDYAGLIDIDSNPGNFDNTDLNLTGAKYEHSFEDDTDRARAIKIHVNTELKRIITGTVWEDKRTYSPEGTNALIGNGIREDGEDGEVGVGEIEVTLHEVISGVSGVVVKEEIAQIYNNDRGWIPGTTTTQSDGTYSFEGYIPGDYIVRFTYNGKTYNGQDYKSTSYQRDLSTGRAIDQNGRTDISDQSAFGYVGYTDIDNQNQPGSYGYSINKADEFGLHVSDAKDIWQVREEANSKYTDRVTNKGAVEQAEGQKLADGSTKYEEMIADTGVIRVEVEYNREFSVGNNEESNNSSNMNYANGNDKNGAYHIKDLDFGLEERPKAGLELNKQVSNVKITLANQSVLFDATQSVEDLIWQAKTPYNIDDMKNGHPTLKNGTTVVDEGPAATKPNAVYSDYTGNKHELFRQAVLERVATMVNNNKGLIQVTMDEEIMHGATITITYDMSVTNIGEEDYKEESFYYTGRVNDVGNIVKTSANLVIDYVANNLQYRAVNNDKNWGWEAIIQNEVNNYVDANVQNAINKKYNNILKTSALGKKLVPIEDKTNKTSTKGETTAEIKLVLMQTITAQNTSDDLQYKNIAEIVSISNDVGRRMAYSIQGNQDPTKVPAEPDASMAEDVTILPPFGTHYLYIGLSLFIITLIAVSIIVIKRTVLR